MTERQIVNVMKRIKMKKGIETDNSIGSSSTQPGLSNNEK